MRHESERHEHDWARGCFLIRALQDDDDDVRLSLRRSSIYNRFRFVFESKGIIKSSSNHRIPNDTNINNTVASSFLSFSLSFVYVSQRECVYLRSREYNKVCYDENELNEFSSQLKFKEGKKIELE